MKKYSLVFALIYIFIFQISVFAQLDDKTDYIGMGVNPKAEEILELRTDISRTFLNPDSSFTVVISSLVPESTEELAPYAKNPRYDIDYPEYRFSPHESNHPISIGLIAEDFHNGINRTFYGWNTTDIPDNATIESSSVQFSRSTRNISATQLIINPLTTNYGANPVSTLAETIYNDCANGDPYGTIDISNTSTPTLFTLTGNTAFNTDIKNRLSANWMAIGMLNSTETGANYYFSMSSGILLVNYSVPPGLKVTPPNWTSINGDGQTLTGVAITNAGTGTALNYTLSVTSGSDWITTSAASGTTPGTISITAKPNFTGTSRTGNIRFSSPGLSDLDMPITQSNLASNLTLPTQEVSGLQSYSVTDWIAANSFVVGTGGNVASLTLRAGNKITLSPGFNAKSDAGTFRAYIQSFTESTPVSSVKDSKDAKDVLSVKDKTNSGAKEKSGMQTDVATVETIPTEYDLFQNYPNPFNPTTTIRFALPEKAFVRLGVFNLLGQQVGEISNTEFDAGFHSVNFNGSSLSSGMYFYRITTDKFSKTLKLLLVK